MKKNIIIQIDGLFKHYKLGVIGHGTFYRDFQSFIAKLLKREDPNSKIISNNLVNKSNKRFNALRNVSFNVMKGEVVGIIGRNGAGKSTLLKILSRITSPSDGSITLHGKVSSLLEVGTGFHSELTGRENIYLNGAIMGMSKDEINRKFKKIVEFSELEEFIDTPVKRYSSGMSVRLAFSVAAHLDPDILVVDEVLAVGDLSFRNKCLNKIHGITSDSQRTVLFVSHDMSSIKALCSRVIVLEKGELIFDGDVNKGIQLYSKKCQLSSLENNGIFTYKSVSNLLHIKKIVLKDKKNIPSSIFKRHDSMTIEVNLKGVAPQNGFNLEWRLSSQFGENLAFGGSYALANKTYSKSDKKIFCKLHDLPLASGSYTLTFMLRVWQQEAWDYKDNAVTFEIDSDLEVDTGFDYEQKTSGPVYIKQDWL